MRLNFESLVYDLPEDVLRAELAGDFDRERRLIERRLADARLSDGMRDRLLVERELIDRRLRRYMLTRAEAIAACKKRIRDFTEEEFDRLEDDGCMDSFYINGERRYLSSAAGTLIHMFPTIAARTDEAEDEPGRLDAYIDEITKNGESAYHYRVRSEVRIKPAAFVPGETYLAHLPIPAACAQQPAGDIAVFADADGDVAPVTAFQRAVCYRRKMDENRPFAVEYEFTSRLKYVNPFVDEPHIVYPDALPVCADDLAEQLPHISFTPYLKRLAQEIAGDETRPLYLARRAYDYVTRSVRYSFMRSYILIERHAEFAALNLKGDCGIQAILFITLCRLMGVPARWQSGLTVETKTTGNHDWAQFYTDEFGWLFADPSYGGGAYRRGDERRWNFYFGNLDPFRMIANRRYQTEFDMPKAFERFDPYDNQDGEIETETRGLDNTDYDTVNTTLAYQKLK